MNSFKPTQEIHSFKLIQEIENDKSSSYWLIDQIRSIGNRDIYDLMRDVDTLKRVLEFQWEETLRELRVAQEQMVVDYLAGKCEHPI